MALIEAVCVAAPEARLVLIIWPERACKTQVLNQRAA